ncbi:OLC1v1037406C1 [Oldenlandia corymbosa var. corymbosa]|uniref:Ninja-family protein n=1 Tax=Oldenlandia corymbosa var. corymbosa TaxID=529605 RepID=A0AAV1CXQ1_OLDCO|nr:OLC1v1037406C1 [Oldenlandia corymbosa var. corymbosa]
MDEDNRLELSLAPPTAGGDKTTKNKVGSSSDSKSDISDRDTKLINEFKQFLDGGNIQIHSGPVSQRVDSLKPENFFTNLPKNPDADTSKSINTGAFWAVNDRPTDGEENRTDTREKRKNVFGETSQPKKQEKESEHSDLQDKPRVSYISISTDAGSTADNEDVADSEAEASTSKRQPTQQDDVTERYAGGIQSDVRKDFHGNSESNGGEAGHKRFSISSEKDLKIGGISHSIQFPTQPVNIMNISQPLPGKDSNSSSASIRTSYSFPNIMQAVTSTSGERMGSQPVLPANVPLMVSYSSGQLPAVDKDNSRVMISHQQIHPSFISSLPINSVIPQKSSDSKQHEGKALDHHLANGQLLSAGTSSLREDNGKLTNSSSFRSRDVSDLPRTEGIPSEYSTIKPGIAADLKFGGSGSYPNLPWVSTTSPGPNGRTISGVTYRFSPTQIKIVCACHGVHMSPEEFVRHASEEPSNMDPGTGVLSTSNPATSAQS